MKIIRKTIGVILIIAAVGSFISFITQAKTYDLPQVLGHLIAISVISIFAYYFLKNDRNINTYENIKSEVKRNTYELNIKEKVQEETIDSTRSKRAKENHSDKITANRENKNIKKNSEIYKNRKPILDKDFNENKFNENPIEVNNGVA